MKKINWSTSMKLFLAHTKGKNIICTDEEMKIALFILCNFVSKYSSSDCTREMICSKF